MSQRNDDDDDDNNNNHNNDGNFIDAFINEAFEDINNLDDIQDDELDNQFGIV